MSDEIVVEPRPPARRQRRSPLAVLLTKVAAEHPNEDVRIREYETNEAARVACYKLRAGIRAPHSRPEGRWEFFYGDITGSPKFGVWAHFYPPTPPPAPDTE